MSWPSRPSSAWAWRSTTLPGRGGWHYTEEVRLRPRSLHASLSCSDLNAAVFGPAATKWYSFLQHKIKLQNHNTTIAARVLADQVVFAPTNMLLFLSSMSVMEGHDPREKLRKSYFQGIQMNWFLWPWVQAVNFKLIPLEHRVLVVNVVSLGWNCYLSWMNSQK
jgi:protein Mpv17